MKRFFKKLWNACKGKNGWQMAVLSWVCVVLMVCTVLIGVLVVLILYVVLSMDFLSLP